MSATNRKRHDGPSTHRKTEPYAVVAGTKGERLDIVLRGLSPIQAEQIAARKNAEINGYVSIHAVSERQLRRASFDLHRILIS